MRVVAVSTVVKFPDNYRNVHFTLHDAMPTNIFYEKPFKYVGGSTFQRVGDKSHTKRLLSGTVLRRVE